MSWVFGRYRALLALVLGLGLSLGTVQPREHHRRRANPQETLIALTDDSVPAGRSGSGIDYLWDIKPILSERCYACHAGTRHRGGLRLDTAALLKKGGRRGPAIVRGHSTRSLLIAAVRGTDGTPRMPPEGEPLEADQIARLEAWIDGGARAPDREEPGNPATTHWAFQPPKPLAVPKAGRTDWVRNPIDAFIARGHDQHQLSPSPPAPPGLLLRRVYLDLTGLPPTAEELRAFLADPSDQAYEKIVDKLLNSPRHAERWARHWMDVWRYSDPDGRKSMQLVWWSNPYLWRWRDWIVSSLRRDKGYDRMIVEMLAGDELAPADPDALAGTGFLARNWFDKNRSVWLDHTVEHTGKAFLGLTLNCARCHDHKYDPISQQEYYRFRALFEPHDIRTDQYPLEPGGKGVGLARAFDAFPERPTHLLVRGDEANPDKSISISPGVPSVLGGALTIRPVRLASRGHKLPENGAQTPTSTGRRLALARWLCDPRNPLTARVAVNHIWARHFGRGFVDNPADFGLKCRRPTQPDLLDWLAVQFQAHHWSMKHLHRLIVTSSLYRMQSAEPPGPSANRELDPENRYWWRMEPRRMEAEVVRDSLLYLAGNLDLTLGGPALTYPETSEVSKTSEVPSASERRSLYYRYSREDKLEFLTIFDPASVEECYRRDESIVPQQALALVNSDWVRRQAHRLARSLDRGADAVFVDKAFQAILCRQPTAQEHEACADFLRNQRDGGRGRLVHVLLNHNDFVTIR
jgi:hypothetical protein